MKVSMAVGAGSALAVVMFVGACAAADGDATPGATAHPAGGGAAAQAPSLRRPPGVQLVTLPRASGEKPQEAFVAVNPHDPRHLVVTYHQPVVTAQGCDHEENVAVTAHAASSRDGGMTWAVADGKTTTHPGYLRSLDTAAAIDVHGHAFLAYIGMDKMSFWRPMTRAGEFVHRSVDGGLTWGPPITLVERPESNDEAVFHHMPKFTADNSSASRFSGALYLTWDRQTYAAGPDGAPSVTSEMMLTRSTDDGKTWSVPEVISPPHRAAMLHSAAVANDGTIFVMYMFYQFKGQVPWEIRLMASKDGGATFSTPLPVASVARPKSDAKGSGPWGVMDFPRAGGWPVMALDPRGAGRVYVAWGDYRNGDRDIMAIASADRGKTWSEPVRVNDDARSNGRDQIMQRLAVDPADGSVYAIFYDRRDDPQNMLTTVTLARSTNGGRSYVNYAWSDKVSDARKASFGDYLGLAAQSGRVYGAWVENAPLAEKPSTHRSASDAAQKYGEHDCPSGPSTLRIGVADFGASAR